tara:strand:- start:27 stop:236 length:210 start_codon:yes stop_codon:yes gene_type:complete
MYVHELKTFFNTVKDGERKVLLYDPKNTVMTCILNKDGTDDDTTNYPTLRYDGMEGPNGEIIFTVIHSK